MPDQPLTAYLEKLVIKAYHVRCSPASEDLLQTSFQSSKRTRNLWLRICFLARLRVAYEVFKRSALCIRKFRSITIFCIPTNKTQHVPPSPALNLDQTLKLLKRKPSLEQFTPYLPRKLKAPEKARKEFDRLQKYRLFVHAEMQMVLHLAVNGHSDHIFGYIGCSKYSCFMCWDFLRAYGNMITRGCHGHLPHGWTIPQTKSLPIDKVAQVTKAIEEIHKKLRRELSIPYHGQYPHIGQSSAGSVNSSPSYPRGPNSNPTIKRYMQDQAEGAKHNRLVRSLQGYAGITF